MTHWTPNGLDFDGATYVVCPEKTERPELWRELHSVTIPSHLRGGTLIDLVPCGMHGTIVCWRRILRTRPFAWARLWWSVAVR